MKADNLISRLLTVPRDERAQVLEQESPEAWDSVLFFAVRDGLRDARFQGQMSAADYVDTLEEVERRYEQGTSRTDSRRASVPDESDEPTIDMIPETDAETADSAAVAAPPVAQTAGDVRRAEHAAVAALPVAQLPGDGRRAERAAVAAPPVAQLQGDARRAERAAVAALPVAQLPGDARREMVVADQRPSIEAPPREPVTPPQVPEQPSAKLDEAPPAAPRVEFVPGATIRSRYVLEKQLGKGGSGVVFRARDVRLDAMVALKVLREQLRTEPEKVERLKREFHQAQALPHPNIIRVFDVDCEGDTWFMTMELLDGESLRSLLAVLQRRRLPEQEALDVIFACADALAFAHEHGVLHCDFKPGNVIVTRDKQVRLLDFGVVDNSAAALQAGHLPRNSRVVAATPGYASPEVLGGEAPDVRDDVYSLACVAYEVLTGRHPFERQSATAARQLGMRVRRLPGLSRRQYTALKRGLAWSRNKRPASVRELVAELRSPLPKRQPVGFWLSVVAAAFGTFVAVTYLLDADRSVPKNGEQAVTESDARVAPANEQGEKLQGVDRGSSMAPPASGMSPTQTDGGAQTRAGPASASTPKQNAGAAVTVTKPPRSAAPAAAAAATTAIIQSQSLPGAGAVTVTNPPQSAAPVSAVAATTAIIQSQSLARAGSVSLSQANIVVSEQATSVAIRVQRHADLRGRLRVEWRVVAGTAQSDSDYSMTGIGSIVIPEDQDVRVIYIPIVNDDVKESNESFDVELVGVAGPARLGPIIRTRVTVFDDD